MKAFVIWLFVLCYLCKANVTVSTPENSTPINLDTNNLTINEETSHKTELPDIPTTTEPTKVKITKQIRKNGPTKTTTEEPTKDEILKQIVNNEIEITNGTTKESPTVDNNNNKALFDTKEDTTTEMPEVTTEAEVISNAICEACECSAITVDCKNKDIKTPFDLADWDGLSNFNPETVDLSHNPLRTLTRISNMTRLKYLNVSHCQIDSIEYATFSYLKNLEVLDLSSNQLTSSSVNRRVFVGLLDQKVGILPYPKLRYLSLANNDIHSFSQYVFAFMTSLTTLDLSGNPLGYIDQVTMGSIADLEDLKELNLSGCKLDSLPEGIFRRHRRLRKLDLSNNKFTTVPPSLSEAVNLEYLDFDKNLIEILNGTNSITKLKSLKELRLSRMPKLHTISDGGLGGLADLEVLYLSFNPKLTVLENNFLGWIDEDTEQEVWPAIRVLYLNNNNLSLVYSGYLERWDILSRVDLSNNPYTCECSNQWLVDVFVPMLASSESNVTLGNMICKKPKEMKGISMLQLHSASKELACPDSQNLMEMPVPDMAILLGIMIGIFVTFPIVLIVTLLWRRGSFARCRSRRIESDSDEETDAF